MNEAGVFGRFIPDFGRVNAQMQFDMYHHYTVDEHTIRAIGLLSRIERGELAEDHPLGTDFIPRLAFRRVLYVATLLHDIAKGRGGDHSVLGAEVAERLCPRLGLDREETELTAWLVRYHLLMSATAFKRDLSDPKTIDDFAAAMESLERLRQLLVLTVVDIRAVGPGIWNSWKRQLLGDLYTLTEERLRAGQRDYGREERVRDKMASVAELLGDKANLIDQLDDRFDEDYWLGEPEDIIALNLPHYAEARRLEHRLSIHCRYYPVRGATLVTVVGDDHPGLFFRIAGAIHLAGGNIIDARIHTTRNGKAVDNFLVQDPLGRPFKEQAQFERIERAIRESIGNTIKLVPQLAKRPLPRSRAEHFRVTPRIFVDNDASRRFTVIEVNATDRPALLNRLTRAMFEERLIINSAHITNYGERAVDTFYVTDLLGGKIVSDERLRHVEEALLDAIAAGEPQAGRGAGGGGVGRISAVGVRTARYSCVSLSLGGRKTLARDATQVAQSCDSAAAICRGNQGCRSQGDDASDGLQDRQLTVTTIGDEGCSNPAIAFYHRRRTTAFRHSSDISERGNARIGPPFKARCGTCDVLHSQEGQC